MVHLGIQMALGSSRSQISAHVSNPVRCLCLISVAVAIPIAMVVSSSMSSSSFEVRPLDPVALIGASLLTSPTRTFSRSPYSLVMDASAFICSTRACHAASWVSAEGSRPLSDSNCFPSCTIVTYDRMSVRWAVRPPQGFATGLVGRLLV